MMSELVVFGQTVGVVICGGGNAPYRRLIEFCPTCNRKRRFVSRWDGMWYGTLETCLACGDNWQGGELRFRPTAPDWRKKSIAGAKRAWENALSPQEWKRMTRAEIDEYLSASKALS